MGDFTIPLGFRFEPTDEELICGFLFPKVTGGAVPWNGVAERKIYGAEAAPWMVFGDVEEARSMFWQTKKEGGATKKTTYVFTRLTAAPKSKRIPRTAGGGTWSGQTAPKKIKSSRSGATIGVSKMFVYESSKFDVTPTSELGHWIMHEYSLSGAGLQEAGLTACDLVLCKITRSIKRISAPPPPRQLIDLAQEDYDQTASYNMKRAAEQGWSQENSSCKKLKTGEGEGFSDDSRAGEGFSDNSRAGVEGDGFSDDHSRPGMVAGAGAGGDDAGVEFEFEGDDILLDMSWILDETQAEGATSTSTSSDHTIVQQQSAAASAIHLQL